MNEHEVNIRWAKKQKAREPLGAHVRSFEMYRSNEKPFLRFPSQNLKPQ